MNQNRESNDKIGTVESNADDGADVSSSGYAIINDVGHGFYSH